MLSKPARANWVDGDGLTVGLQPNISLESLKEHFAYISMRRGVMTMWVGGGGDRVIDSLGPLLHGLHPDALRLDPSSN